MKTFLTHLGLRSASIALILCATTFTANAQVPTPTTLDQPTPEQLVVLQKRVVEFKNTINSDLDKAQNADKQLSQPGNCGDGTTVRSCLQSKINQLKARADLIDDPAQLEAANETIQTLQIQLDAPEELRKTAAGLTQFSGTLDQMLKDNDFTFKEQFGIIWKSLVGSWKYLISPVALSALSLGGAGYGAASLSALDQTAKNAFNFTPSPGVSALKEIGTLCGYGVCMVPVALIALITKDPNSIEAMDSMIVGTGLVEAIGPLVKDTTQVDRPVPEPAGSFDRWGTLSLHAAESSMMTTVICRHYNKVWCGVAIAVTAGVELSREVGGDHYPSQLLLGTSLGIASGYAADRAVMDATQNEKKSKSDVFLQALTGNINYKGFNFDYKPDLLPQGGTGGHLNITW